MRKTKKVPKIYIEDIRIFQDMTEQRDDVTIEIVDSVGNYDRSIDAYEDFVELLEEFYLTILEREKLK